MGFLPVFSIVFSFSLQLISVDSSSITFCDGSAKIEKTRDQCGSGYNFGDSKPDCVCIKGIYRIWTDTCEVADGFAEEICTKLTDEKTQSKILGLRLSNDPKDWNQTGVVCDRKGFGKDFGWGFISEDPVATATSSDHIYVLNGQALITSDGNICVRPTQLPENKKICKYLKKDNLFHWKNTDVTISIGGDCTGSPLMSSACFGVLKSSSSECRLSCSPSGPQGRGFGGLKKPASSPAPTGRSLGGSPAKGRSLTPAQKGPPQPDADIMTNISNPADYRQHDNKFLNRKMLIFNVISQIETGEANASADSKIPFIYGQPVKTFELFNLMKDITKISCPPQYVNPDWIDMTIDLFYILHKGHVFRYDELVSQEQYEWIKDILMKCWDNLNSTAPGGGPVDPDNPDQTGPGTGPVPITGNNDKCASEAGKVGTSTATGYCKPPVKLTPEPTEESDVEGEESSTTVAPPEEPCVYTPIELSPNRADPRFHYVPDVAWDIVDMIQVRCFPQFNESYRMFHVLEQAAEKLFTLQIKNLWYYPGWSPKTKSKLLGAGADLQMHNLEMCVEAAYLLNGKIPRLQRPPPPKYIRKRRSTPPETLISMSKTSEAYCVKSQGDFVYPKNCKALPE